MKKLKFLSVTALVSLFLTVLATAVLAQEEIPAPYAGLKNPLPWGDVPAQEAGK